MNKEINVKGRTLKAFIDILSKQNNGGDFKAMLGDIINRKDVYNYNRQIFNILSYIKGNAIDYSRLDIAYETIKSAINEACKADKSNAKNNMIEIDREAL